MYNEFDGPEPYENDLEELGNREAWEDAQAERDIWDDWEDDYDDDEYEEYDDVDSFDDDDGRFDEY